MSFHWIENCVDTILKKHGTGSFVNSTDMFIYQTTEFYIKNHI